MSSFGGNASSAPLSFCHECSSEIRPLMQPGPTCPQCGSDFVEEMTPSAGYDDPTPSRRPDAPQTSAYDSTHGGVGFNIGVVLSNLLSSFVGSRNTTHHENSSTAPQRSSQPQWQQSGPSRGAANGGPRVRSGAGNLGPFAFQWQTSSSSFPNNGRASMPRSGSSSSSSNDREGYSGGSPYVQPDDGMGGAGGGADGRTFDFGSSDEGNDRERQQMPFGFGGAFGMGAEGSAGPQHGSQQPAVPPEFAALRNIFVDLFGATEAGTQGQYGGREGTGVPTGDLLGGLFSTFFGGAANGGRMGDYVFGQQGLDDIITQIMEQTQGSTAPPPASEEAIAKLRRLKVGDPAASKLARNRECPTCLDIIIPSTAPSSPTRSRRFSQAESANCDDGVEDPPEYAAGEEPTSDTLVILPCKHTGHEECIVPWLQRNGTCPICREALEPSTATNRAPDHQQQGTGASASTQTSSETPHDPSDIAATDFGEMLDTDEEADQEEEDPPEERRRKMRQAAERRNPSAGGSAEGHGHASVSGVSPAEDIASIRSIPGDFRQGLNSSRGAQGDPYDLD